MFSFWKQTLDIVEKMFLENELPYLRIDGDVPLRTRKKILSEFATRGDVVALLMTLGTGAMG